MIESGKRVKFITKFIQREAPQDKDLGGLINCCKELHKSGLMPVYPSDGRSSGNLSYRTDEGFIITASGLKTKDKLTCESFVEIPFQRNKHLIKLCEELWENRPHPSPKKLEVYCNGVSEPSSETILHFAVYNFRKDIGSVIHGHSENILITSSEKGIVQTDREYEFGSTDLVESVLKVLKDNEKINFFILKNHGFISLGKSLEEATKLAIDFQKS